MPIGGDPGELCLVVQLPDPGTLIGASNTWPAGITNEATHAGAWRDRKPLGGYIVPAKSENTSYNLVIHLIADAGTKSASLGSVQVGSTTALTGSSTVPAVPPRWS